MTHRPLPATDRLGRPLRDLRVSVTDRCNFRCGYCMPSRAQAAGVRFRPRRELLGFEEIERLVRLFARLGVRKVRLTGGEPLLRRDLPDLVRMLSSNPGLEIALTTNGSLLAEQARALADAGLSRVTVSLDSLDDSVFRAMNDVDVPVARVLDGIEAAGGAGLGPVKINAVVIRGVNDHTVVGLARHFKGTPHVVRFIEFMDAGVTNGWEPGRVVSAAEILARIHAEMPLTPVSSAYRGEVATRYRYVDGGGEIGVVASITRPFCGDCTRLRLSAEGRLFSCLFASAGIDLRTPLRLGSDDRTLTALIRDAWSRREDRYSEVRFAGEARPRRAEMSYLGG